MSSLDDYDVLQEIGKGTYGKVYKARLKRGDRNEIFAIKKIDFIKANSKELEQLRREEDILKLLCDQKHENIVRYIASFSVGSVLYIVTEYCSGGSLFHYLCERKTGLEEYEFKIYLEQILNGVKYLHSKKITHRDLKTKNILLTSDSKIKIADFGVAKIVDTCSKAANTVMVGTPHYIAPEMMGGKGTYDEKIDIWAIGCDCYEMGTSNYAFDGKTAQELKEAVSRNKLPNINSLRFCENIQKMIIRLLAPNPCDRPDAEFLFNEVSRHHCQNIEQPYKHHKETQVFCHSTAIPGHDGKKVFLSSQSSNISTIPRGIKNSKEPTQNTDSFDEKQKGEMISIEGPMPSASISPKGGEQNTDSFDQLNRMSSSSLEDSFKSTSSSRSDSQDDITSLYEKSVHRFDKKLCDTLRNAGGRDIYRKLGQLIMEESYSVDFEVISRLLGERFAALQTLVITLKNLEDGLKIYSKSN
ncbi:serine/threonine-protein kinase Nek1-like [Saccostrea echinata]|uniref:serine/threonine-protein kinase Nek1-like n=1 Tax=Saccostrea echinata TaxID=191078 RepID=UPI002A81464D|nr:serine/threonine-protein kinase Nek1-like [Saccostrea echinata]